MPLKKCLCSGARDQELEGVVEVWRRADPDGRRAGDVFRRTFDQLYDGQHTGRYRWDQLFKTEKTHYGTLLEINLRREFDDIIDDGIVLDYSIAGTDVDCKYSQKEYGWMIPPEAFDQLLLVATADDAAGEWSLGVVRARETNIRESSNRDKKTQLNKAGRSAVCWISRKAPLPPNVLLNLPEEDIERIFTPRSGQGRVNNLLRVAVNQRIGRSAIATVAQQNDYMKRVRYNGGARSALRSEGYIILGGDFTLHRDIAEGLGAAVPEAGEFVSVQVVAAEVGDPRAVRLQGTQWRLARTGDQIRTPAPLLPEIRRF